MHNVLQRLRSICFSLAIATMASLLAGCMAGPIAGAIGDSDLAKMLSGSTDAEPSDQQTANDSSVVSPGTFESYLQTLDTSEMIEDGDESEVAKPTFADLVQDGLIDDSDDPLLKPKTRSQDLRNLEAIGEEMSGENFKADETSPFEYRLPRTANDVPKDFRDLSIRQMMRIAFAHSPVLRPFGVRVLEYPELAPTVYDPAVMSTDPYFGKQAALAEFDWEYYIGLGAQNNDRVYNNSTLGGDVLELTQDRANLNTRLHRRTKYGTWLELTTQTNYDNNNRSGNLFPSAWNKEMMVRVRQPLLRGAGTDFNLTSGPHPYPDFTIAPKRDFTPPDGFWIACVNSQMAHTDFELKVREFTRDLLIAYWELHRAYRVYENALKGMELTKETYEITRQKREAGVAGGEVDKEALSRSIYYSFAREAQLTLDGFNDQRDKIGLYVLERQLRRLMGIAITDDVILRPSAVVPESKYIFDYRDLLARAQVSRPELHLQALKIRRQELRLIGSKNACLPILDVIAGHRVRGFGDDLAGGGDDRFSNAYRDLFSYDHQEFVFGVEFGGWVGHRHASTAIRNATIQLMRDRRVLGEQERTIAFQVGDAHAEVISSFEALENSRQSVAAAEERLEAVVMLFDNGRTEMHFLLDAQEDLLKVKFQKASDEFRYAQSLMTISAVTGTILDEHGIHIAGGSTQVDVLVDQDRPERNPLNFSLEKRAASNSLNTSLLDAN